MVDRVKIDETDVKILKCLLKDARTRFTDIATECGVSANTIVKRFYKLKRSGVIAGTSLLIKPEYLGYKFRIAMSISADTKNTDIYEVLQKHSGIIGHFQAVGTHDIHVHASTTSFEKIDELRNLLKKKKGVKKVGITANIDEPVFFPENLLIQPTET